jgi:hypothetical protein
MIYILLLICAYTFLTIYDQYFRRKNKISDKHLMENYIFVTMKKENARYFPKMELKDERFY